MTGQRPIRGILWMLLTGLLFVGVSATVKYSAQDLPAAQAAFLRYLFGLVFLLPMIWQLRTLRLPRQAWHLFALRGVVHTVAVAMWFFAMTRIPLAEIAAMNFLAPIYVTILATLFLGERFVPARGFAIAAAFAGTLMILRPGFRELGDGHLAMLLTALAFAASFVIAKRVADLASPAAIVAILSLTVTLGLTPFAWAVWVPPSLAQVFWLTVTAALATAGHYTMALAFREAPITATQPVTFLQLVWATLLGAVVFDEAIDALSVAGGAVIAGSVILLAIYEAQSRRRIRERTALNPD